MSIFKGAGVAIVTPMHEDGSVNYEALSELIEFQISHSTDAIIICGTTGESSTLSHEEHVDCIRYTVERVAGRVPVIAGTGSNCTAEAVDLSIKAEAAGADALLVVTPYYNKCTQNGLAEYYSDIAHAVKIPVIMYNVPSRTGCNILPETAMKAASMAENIVAVKEASGNISQVAKLAALSRGRLDIYSGNDDQIIPILSLGGKGVISVLSNVAPEQTHDMCRAFFEGRTEEAARMQLEAIDLCGALFCEVNPIPVKAALNMMGKKAGVLRKPLTEMEDGNKERLKKAMEAYGLLA